LPCKPAGRAATNSGSAAREGPQTGKLQINVKLVNFENQTRTYSVKPGESKLEEEDWHRGRRPDGTLTGDAFAERL